ncbi:MAG: hypothetical protein IJ677_02325 [Alphaproteobacteria bacterium]|nr:hypothetical protein [Alphaproteobacteria bacterium]
MTHENMENISERIEIIRKWIKVKQWLKKNFWNIIGILVILELAALYAQNYTTSCKNLLGKDVLGFFGIIYTQGVLAFMQHFSWAFLILLLFLIPSCINNIKDLFENACKIVTKTSYFQQETPKQQDEKDKEIFNIIQTEQENIVKDDITEETKSDGKKAGSVKKIEGEFEKRMKIREKLRNFILEHTREMNIDNFVIKSKVAVTDDPISSDMKLLFDYSYRFKGNSRTRRYINTLIVPNSVRSADMYYRYIRIMNDINSAHRNQRFAIELVLLNLDNSRERNTFDTIIDMYSKAIDNGVLAVKECCLDENNIPQIIREYGWVLETQIYD